MIRNIIVPLLTFDIMTTVAVTNLVQAEIHTTFPAQWKKLLIDKFITLSGQYNLKAIRLTTTEKDVKSLGLKIEQLICDTIQDIPINPQICAKDGTHATLVKVLEGYRVVLAKCAGTLSVTTQRPLNYTVDGYLIKGIADVMLNTVNILEIKHTAKETGLDQLIHYAALYYLSTKKMIWYITLCNTNLGTVKTYKISNKFYSSGEAARYLEESVECWKTSIPALPTTTSLAMDNNFNNTVEYQQVPRPATPPIPIPGRVSSSASPTSLPSYPKQEINPPHPQRKLLANTPTSSSCKSEPILVRPLSSKISIEQPREPQFYTAPFYWEGDPEPESSGCWAIFVKFFSSLCK